MSKNGQKENSVMYRGRNKKLSEPTSEYSLSTIKSEDGDSILRESINCDKTVNNMYVSQTENPNETSRLINENSGYGCLLQFYSYKLSVLKIYIVLRDLS